MRKINTLNLVAFSTWILLSADASAESLVSAVKHQIQFSTFDKTRMDAKLSLVVSTPVSKVFYDREDVENFHSGAEAKHLAYQISHFKVLSLDESSKSRFASITYSVDYNLVADPNAQATHIVSREIWDRKLNHWYRLYAALEQQPR